MHRASSRLIPMEPTNADLLNEILDGWGKDEIKAIVDSTRIGEDFGFADAVYRLTVETERGIRTMVAKTQTAEQVENTVSAYGLMVPALFDHVPRILGHSETLVLFEDITPAEQGDGLRPESGQIEAIVAILARLHASTWTSMTGEWIPAQWERDRWVDRLARARQRYPQMMDDDLYARLELLHEEIPAAIDVLGKGPRALIHTDSGLDNTLWRADGSAVLLDWSNARIGPPGYDVALHLEGIGGDRLLEVYMAALQRHDIEVDRPTMTRQIAAGSKIVVRGLVGFAGLPAEPAQPRLLRFRDIALQGVRRHLAYLDNGW